ncbi:2911_t:CDS:2, partial [Racocetra persica]
VSALGSQHLTVVLEALSHNLATTISHLSPYHFCTLCALFSYLSHIDSKSDMNKDVIVKKQKLKIKNENKKVREKQAT